MNLSLQYALTFQNRLFLFMTACILGFLFAFIWNQYVDTVEISRAFHQPSPNLSFNLQDTHYKSWFDTFNFSRNALAEEVKSFGPEKNHQTEASFLYNKTTILCIVFINSHSVAEIIKQTWGKHCNQLVFFGKVANKTIPINLYTNFCNLYLYCESLFGKTLNWLFISNEKTFAIIENLRLYVSSLNSSRPYYLGHPVQTFSATFNLGEAGIVISKGAWRVLETDLVNNGSCKSFPWTKGLIDQSLGQMLKLRHIFPQDTRDSSGRGRFNPFSIEKMLLPGKHSMFNSFWIKSVFPHQEGGNCCSPQAITFGGIRKSQMYMLEYLLHSLTLFVSSSKGFGNHPPLYNPKKLSLFPTGHSFIRPVSLSSKLSSSTKMKVLS